ncbi:hypothetical protein J6R97_06260 [bacterium]|jgi:transcriptional regulator of NAD metabolism|nr:hypothetical protein [bacterium]
MVSTGKEKILLDPFMLRQYTMILSLTSEEYHSKERVKKELEQLRGLEDINEARELIYRLCPSLKEHPTYYYDGVKFTLRDTEDKLSLLVKLNTEIMSYSFRAKK